MVEDQTEDGMACVQLSSLLYSSEGSVQFDQAINILALLAHLLHTVVHAHSKLFFAGRFTLRVGSLIHL